MDRRTWHGAAAGESLVGGGSETEFLGQLLEAIPAPVFFKDAEQIYRGCNAAFERFLGQPRERIVGKSVFDVAPPELAQRYYDQDQALLDNPPLQVYEADVQTSEGRRTVVFHKATYVDANGRVAGIVGVILDVTERRQAEDALRDALAEVRQVNEHLRVAARVFDTTTEGIVLAQRGEGSDTDYRIIDVNNAFCHLTGWSKADMLGRNVALLQSDEHPHDFYTAVEESLRSFGEWKGEVRFPRADGTIFPAWMSLSLIREDDEFPETVVGVFTDLSELRERSEQDSRRADRPKAARR